MGNMATKVAPAPTKTGEAVTKMHIDKQPSKVVKHVHNKSH